MDGSFDWAQVYEYTKSAIGLLKDVKDLLPAGKKRDEVTQKLEAAERQLKLAEAKAAQELGYHLCQCTFPPTTMLKTGNNGRQDIFTCSSCHAIWPPPRPTHATEDGGPPTSWMAR